MFISHSPTLLSFLPTPAPLPQSPLKHTVSSWPKMSWTLLLQKTIKPVFITFSYCPAWFIFDPVLLLIHSSLIDKLHMEGNFTEMSSPLQALGHLILTKTFHVRNTHFYFSRWGSEVERTNLQWQSGLSGKTWMQTLISKHSFHAVFQVLYSYLDKVFKEINVDTLLWAMGLIINWKRVKPLNSTVFTPTQMIWESLHVLPSDFALEIPEAKCFHSFLVWNGFNSFPMLAILEM